MTFLRCLPALLSAVIVLAGALRGDASEGGRPHVLVILVDDMGYADIGCSGARDIRTPRIDRLASEGVLLTEFYANGPVCTPTRAALMTGRYQQRVGLEWAIPPGMKGPGLPGSETSVATMLKGAGYRTAIFGKWHLGYRPEFNPIAHGFDEFFGILSGNVDHYAHREINGEPDLLEGLEPVERPGYMTDLIIERAVGFLDRHAEGDAPFFLYVPFNAVHWPFQPPDAPGDTRTRETWFDGTRADYVRMMERIDESVGRLLDALDRHGLADDTLVIFTNDNGGERLSDNGPLSRRKGTLWEGGIRVPCLIRWPGHLPAGTRSDVPAATMDLSATLLSASGVTPPEGRTLDGIDLLPILRGEAPAPDRALFWRIARPNRLQKAAREGRWKYLRDGGNEHLFDLSDDPSERHDLSRQEPDRLARLRGQVDAWEEEMDRHAKSFVVK